MKLTDILLAVTGFYPKKTTNGETRTIRVERQSVSMGDDCTAPNATELTCTEGEKLSDFLVKVSTCVPAMRNSVWPVYYKHNVIAYMIFDGNGKCTIERIVKDINVWSIAPTTLFCKYYYEGMLADAYPECKTLIEKVKKDLSR